LSIDAAIAKEVLRVLKALGMEAAVKAIEAQSSETTAAERQLELSLQQARYEVAHARRQYDAVIQPIGSSPASWSADGTRQGEAIRKGVDALDYAKQGVGIEGRPCASLIVADEIADD
jgi:hypothetical protein